MVDRGLEKTLTVSNFRKIKEVLNTNIDSTASQETEHKRHVYVPGCV